MTANDLAAWAHGDAARIAQIKAERDALVARMLNGGKDDRSVTAVGAGGKSFGFQINMPPAEKLAVLTGALDLLGEVPAAARPVTMTHATFGNLER
jgi:hypothetical protein